MKKIENKKAIIFAKDAQDYTEQVNRMTAVAIDDGYSKSNLVVITNKDERDFLQQLQQAIAADSSINAVYVFDISRLGRRMADISSVVKWLIKSNIQLELCNTPYVFSFGIPSLFILSSLGHQTLVRINDELTKEYDELTKIYDELTKEYDSLTLS